MRTFHSLLDVWLLFERYVRRKSVARQHVPDSSEDVGNSEFIRKLRSCLRRCPTWVGGHRELFYCSLVDGDLSCAYACAHAVQKLMPNSLEGKTLLGTCFVRSGDFLRAVTVLESVLQDDTTSVQAKEELGAALVALGEKARAKEVLLSIPETARSLESMTALTYLENSVTS